ncbi:uncharacterized protein LOC111706364 isoform X2 [Eurytemora carolleeae]|uniref:uncharacterized protein LOC111706364 isoform X2 n=1 Tax=Eurytemora carolleeae TaxID=1294199 RepID=UPI000C75EEFE|nr:uncharacterized protein LOC111706364 isoform X2 [Eurytemora carolleeae]|eukprot:XP_023334993.1 uncharacterized protein LOC111706364 isoform X2 [Eurytemora affinis]
MEVNDKAKEEKEVVDEGRRKQKEEAERAEERREEENRMKNENNDNENNDIDEEIIVLQQDIIYRAEHEINTRDRQRRTGSSKFDEELKIKLNINLGDSDERENYFQDELNFDKHKDVSRQTSKGSINDKSRGRNKKFSITSTHSALSAASSYSDSPYIHLMHDTLDRGLSTLSSDGSGFKRKISEGPAAFHEIETEFTLSDLELDERPPLPPPVKEKTAPAKPIRTSRPGKFRGKQGGSKVFEDYEKVIKNRTQHSLELEQDLYTVQETESRNKFANTAIPSPTSRQGIQYLSSEQDNAPFVRQSPGRSTFCTSQIKESRDSKVSTGNLKKPPMARSHSFRKSFQKFGDDVAKTFRNLAGKMD